MRIKKLLKDKKVILPLLIGVLSASMSFTPRTVGSTSLASMNSNGVNTNVDFLDNCNKIEAKTCRVKVTAEKDGEKSETIYTLDRNRLEGPTEAQKTEGSVSGELADVLEVIGKNPTDPKESEEKQDKDTVFYQVTVINESCSSCSPINHSINPLNLKNLETAKIAGLLSSVFDASAKMLEQEEANKVLNIIAQKKQEEEQKKRQAKIDNCEMNEDGESLKKYNKRQERLECLFGKLEDLDLEEDRQAVNFFNGKIKKLLHQMLLSQNPEDRSMANDLLYEYGDSIDNANIRSQLIAMQIGAHYMNQTLELAQDSAFGDANTRLFNNSKLDYSASLAEYYLKSNPAVMSSGYGQQEAQAWISKVKSLTSSAINDPNSLANNYFVTDMQLGGIGDNLSLPLLNGSNRNGSPVFAPPTINGPGNSNVGRGIRSNRYTTTTIPQLGQRYATYNNQPISNFSISGSEEPNERSIRDDLTRSSRLPPTNSRRVGQVVRM